MKYIDPYNIFINEQKSDAINIVIIQGSPRSKDSCPDEISKTRRIINETLKYFKDQNVNFDIIDLAVGGKSIIQPCKGCISTAGGAHCHYPCSCYEKNSKDFPDKIYDDNIYKRLEKADAFLIYSPIHWYSLSSVIKSLFDRLVCINKTITHEQADKIFNGHIKDSTLTKPFSKTNQFKNLVKNQWERKYAGFFVQGDDGANDYIDENYPESMLDYMDDFEIDKENCVIPFVLQLRYSGIHVPADLIEVLHINEDMPYADAEIDDDTIKQSIALIERTIKYLK